MKPEAFRLTRSVYPYFRRVIARFSDIDAERHLNNIALASFYEDARVSFFRDLISARQDFRFVVANISVCYLAEAHYPGEYEVGLGVTRLGHTSFDVGCGLFLGDGCVGTCDTTQVTLGPSGPIPIPDILLSALHRMPLRQI